MKHVYLVVFFLLLSFKIWSQKNELFPEAVLVKKTSVKLNGVLNAALGGVGRSVVEFILPENTRQWYYSFTTRRDNASDNANRGAIDLTVKVAGLIAAGYTGGASTQFSGLLSSQIKSLTIPAGSVPVNVYAIDPSNIQNFKSGQSFYPMIGSANESQLNGSSLINSYLNGVAYIGLYNPNARNGVIIDVEVTAIVMKRKTVGEEISVPKTESNNAETKSNENDFYVKNITDTVMAFRYSTNQITWNEVDLKPGEIKRMKSTELLLYVKYLSPNDEIVVYPLDADHVYYFKPFNDKHILSYFKE